MTAPLRTAILAPCSSSSSAASPARARAIALNVLEDAGYYCVDNLPAPLLPHLVDYLAGGGYEQVAVAIDMRGGAGVGGAAGYSCGR